MNNYLRVIRYIKPYLSRVFAAIFCTIAAAAGNLSVPWIVKDMIDQVLASKDIAMLNYLAILVIGIFFLRGLFFYGQSYLMAYVGQKIVIDIRRDVYRHINRLSMSFFEKNKTGTIMSYVTNDVNALQEASVDSVIDLCTESVVLIGSIVAMFLLDWKLTLFTFITFPLVLQLINVFGKKIRATAHRIQQSTADITSVLQETITSAKVVKSFVREDYEIDRFEKENFRNFRANIKNAQLGAILTPLIEFVAAIGATIILWIGGMSVINGETTAGALVAFLIYAINLSNPIKRLTKVYTKIQRAMAAAQRVFGVMDMAPEIVDAPEAIELQEIEGNVEFKNVYFEYNINEPVINDLSFNINKGQMVAIVGPSGSGKTTISNLLCRFYDTTGGNIFIDGQDIKKVTVASLRTQVGIVPQETILFNGSVYDNILYGRLDATKEDVEAAARAANAEEFIKMLPDGYNTLLGDRGVNISGGQRQRISIARAILKNPRILILDEATSALDTESEKIVQEALDRLLVGRTSFVIAHRLSTIQRANTILVLDKGNIVEQGTHSELLAKEGLYAALHRAQFNDNEVENGEN